MATSHRNSDPIRIHYESDGTVTKATVTLPVNFADGVPGRLKQVGEARKHPKDDDDPAIAESLSLSRALYKLAGQLNAFAEYQPTFDYLLADNTASVYNVPTPPDARDAYELQVPGAS